MTMNKKLARLRMEIEVVEDDDGRLVLQGEVFCLGVHDKFVQVNRAGMDQELRYTLFMSPRPVASSEQRVANEEIRCAVMEMITELGQWVSRLDEPLALLALSNDTAKVVVKGDDTLIDTMLKAQNIIAMREQLWKPEAGDRTERKLWEPEG